MNSPNAELKRIFNEVFDKNVDKKTLNLIYGVMFHDLSKFN